MFLINVMLYRILNIQDRLVVVIIVFGTRAKYKGGYLKKFHVNKNHCNFTNIYIDVTPLELMGLSLELKG